MIRMLKWVVGVVGCVVAAGAVYFIFWFGSDIQPLARVYLFGPYPDGRDASWRNAAGDELIRANNEHFEIAVQLSKCFPGVNLASGPMGPPAKVAVAFMLNIQPNGENIWLSPPDTEQNAAKSTSDPFDISITSFQRSILTLSRSTAVARADFAATAANSRSTMITFQWLIVIVGALTTILVSIKSMSNSQGQNPRAYFWVGVLAVIFSAIGTALSSINSFISPNDLYVRTERALLQTRQVHFELAVFVASESDLCGKHAVDRLDDPRGKRIADLGNRLKDLVGASDSVAPSGTTGKPGSPSSPPGGQTGRTGGQSKG